MQVLRFGLPAWSLMAVWALLEIGARIEGAVRQ
jgi:hypothetical protein